MFHSDAEFREPRVIELWEAAKRANLSGDELDSLKVVPPSITHITPSKLLLSQTSVSQLRLRSLTNFFFFSVKCFLC